MDELKNMIKSLLVTTRDIDRSYDMGKDYALNGVNKTNCHFSLFASREQTEAWERGKKDGEKEQDNA